MSRSKEAAMAAGIKVRETQHNMKRRKPWHNYRRKGTYMLTLVVAERLPLLGRLIIPAAEPTGVMAEGKGPATTPAALAAGPATTPVASAAGSHIELTPLGKAIHDEEIQKISAIYKTVEVWKLCIMPDHIHMIVRVSEELPEGKHLGHIVAGFKGGCSRAWRSLISLSASATAASATTPVASAAGPATTPVASAARPATTPVASAAGPATTPVASAAGSRTPNWKHYLDDNPRRLAIKRLRPDYFTTLNYADIAEWHCQLVGNSFLLDIPQKVAVIVHRAYSDKEYAEYRKKWLACGEAGGILVSAAIAPREKEVMREALNRGYRIIFVRENGFPPLYKPSGESFDACSDGRLLQVSPWEYHMKRRKISREQCLMLNRLVEEIVKPPC